MSSIWYKSMVSPVGPGIEEGMYIRVEHDVLPKSSGKDISYKPTNNVTIYIKNARSLKKGDFIRVSRPTNTKNIFLAHVVSDVLLQMELDEQLKQKPKSGGIDMELPPVEKLDAKGYEWRLNAYQTQLVVYYSIIICYKEKLEKLQNDSSLKPLDLTSKIGEVRKNVTNHRRDLSDVFAFFSRLRPEFEGNKYQERYKETRGFVLKLEEEIGNLIRNLEKKI